MDELKQERKENEAPAAIFARLTDRSASERCEDPLCLSHADAEERTALPAAHDGANGL